MVAIASAKGVLHPRGQTGCLIVQEQTTKLYGRLAVSILTWQDSYIVALRYWHVHPPVPGRHAHLLAELIDAIDGTATVTACNNQLSVDGGDDKLLALALQVLQHLLLHPLVYLLIAANSTNEDGWGVALRGGEPHDTCDVLLQVGGSNLYRLRLLVTITNRGTSQ